MSKPTRVVLCTTPSIMSAAVLHVLSSAPGIEVVGLVASTRVLKARYGFLRGAFNQIALSGWRYAVYLMVATQGFRLIARYKRIPLLKDQVRYHSIPTLHTKDINQETDWIERFDDAVYLTAFFNQRIGAALLSRRRWLNIHPGALPEYRGVDPVFHAMLDGAKPLYVAVHELEESFDTGRVFAVQQIEPGAILLDNTVEAFAQGARIAVAPLCDEAMEASPQAVEGVRYDSWPDASQVQSFLAAGNRLF